MVRLRVFVVYSTLFLQYSQPESPISTSKNIFDNLPVFNSVAAALFDEITRYLNTGSEHVKNEDLLIWWYEHRHVYPHLSRMALDYHTIPGMTFLKNLTTTQLLTYIKLRLSLLSASLVKGDLSCHMSVTVSPLSQSKH